MAHYRLPILVAVGGVIGAATRYGTQEALGTGWWPLFVINLVGSLIIGWLVGQHLDENHLVWGGVGIGFCGGLTTFSGFALQVARLLDGSDWAGGLALALGTSALAVVGAGVGYRMGRRV